MVEQIIMRIGSEASSNFDFEHIIPARGKSFSEQVGSCIEQLAEFIYPAEEARYYVTQQTFFIAARSREEYDQRAALIGKMLSRMCGLRQPATSVVAQSPVEGSEVVLELMCTRAAPNRSVTYRTLNGIPYTVVNYEGFKAVHAGGLTGDPVDGIAAAAEKAFSSAVKILDEEGLSIHHIVRQWNYIEDIAFVNGQGGVHQNYQDFNDVRSHFYERGTFADGYPAATGIGMDTGGVVIDFIALSPSQQVSLKPIHNPGQIDAHRYSEQVLMGASTIKCTPKFERAKLISFDSSHYIYVSGTASILGEKTMHAGDVEKQTITTIENIYRLFSVENQKELGVPIDVEKIRFSHLRVYVKRQEDVPVVRKICREKLKSNSYLFLESDVCREELLVEIEGMFRVDHA